MTAESSDSDAAPEYEKVGEYVSIYERNGNWYANFQHQGKQVRKSLKTKSKKEARRRALIIERDITTGDFEQTRQAPRLADVITQYTEHLDTEGRSAKTIGKYMHCFGLVQDLADRKGIVRISGIDVRFMDAFRRERVDNNAKPKTVHNDTITIKQLVNFAVKRGLLRENPLRNLKIKKPKRTPQPFWTREQMDLILAKTSSPHREPLILLSETGIRVGELKHLTWDDIDFDAKRPVIRIRPKAGWKPKSGDERIVPMSATARAILENLPRTADWVFTARVTPTHPQPGRQVSERRLLQYLQRILKQLKLPGHLHTFRHSFISHCLAQGTPESVVRSWVGHVDEEVLRWYTHIADTTSHDWMKRVEESKAVSEPLESAKNKGQSSAHSQNNPRSRKNAKSAK